VASSPLLVNAAELLRQPGSRRHVDTAVPRDDLDVDDPRLEGEVRVELVAESTLDDVVVSGTLTVGWNDQCRRCLRPLHPDLCVDVEERYATAESPAVNDHAFPIEHGQLDLRPMIREGILLAVTDAPLCRDDCPGLCPICGADLVDGPCGCAVAERDERWAVLDQLRLDPG